MTARSAEMEVCGEVLVADASGAAFWPARGVLLVADLHFEKGSAYAARGQFLPPYDTRATLKALDVAITRYRPRTVIALGDSFHDGNAGERISADDLEAIRTLTSSVDWLWLTGNHDETMPAGIGGRIAAELTLGALTFRHEPAAAPSPGEVAGHLHPAAVVRTRNRTLRRRCFVGDGQRLILPAFGAFTGGLDISDAAFAGLFERAPRAWVLGRDGVYAVPPQRIAGVA